jgi:hypothetical protein
MRKAVALHGRLRRSKSVFRFYWLRKCCLIMLQCQLTTTCDLDECTTHMHNE